MDAPLLKFIGTLVLTTGAAVCYGVFIRSSRQQITRMESLYLTGKVQHATYRRFTDGMWQTMILVSVVLLLMIAGSVAQILNMLGIL
ncbi:hypothetical protein [Arsenicibacter rosenii]|uniref:Uncharacterized protein n=1 Tax=Arsenicibacter rosenii TaxID=1750698 RepID=A0A1S2VMZ4_9BACT|nr:hypothetical protein [Arsenicibacter rosenii]OIN59770.1 hypothetical protein BLX24_07900 [Arsenicibacter rosenii]